MIPKDMIVKGKSVTLMKKRRDTQGFRSIGDAIQLQIAQRNYRDEKRKHIRSV